jgi:streptogramin lyase
MQELATGLANPEALAVGDDAVFVAVRGTAPTYQDGAVVRVDRATGSATKLAESQRSPRGVAVDAMNVYFTSYADGAVYAVSRKGGEVTTLATSQFQPTAIAVDASGIYWVNDFERGAVVRMKDKTITVLASEQGVPRALCLDATSVYWVNNFDGRVLRVAK